MNYYNESKIVNKDIFSDIQNTHPVRNAILISKDQYLVSYNPKIERVLEVDNLGNPIILIKESPTRPVISNVAIAAAITAVSRSVIHPFKCDPNNPWFYSDTDSIFVQHPLNSSITGPLLGQFKDELKGGIIEHGIFLRPKCYGYITDTGIQKVVIAGFPSKETTFTQLLDVLNGAEFKIQYKSLVKDRENITMKEYIKHRTLKVKLNKLT